jgi:GT2 family glycosyltransferase
MNPPVKHLVVVLGMHRSGTSAMTRGLQVLGVDLGSHLMSPAPGINDKGFFEDAEINGLNDELLHRLGQQWHSLTPIAWDESSATMVREFKARAVALLRSRMKASDVFGIKDPRLSKLLPFWRSVFNDLPVQPGFLIACRNPLSVARSLARRDGFESGKSHYLWLEHTLATLIHTADHSRLVVDFDRLMDDPAAQLGRIARCLNMDFDPASPAFHIYRNEFLDHALRHTRFATSDLERDEAVPASVVQLYRGLQDLAAERIGFDSPQYQSLLARMMEHRQIVRPALVMMDTRDRQFASLKQTVAEHNNQMAALSRVTTQREDQIIQLNHLVIERDARVAALSQSLEEHRSQVSSLAQAHNALLASRSWRVTAPLRLLGRHARRIRRVLQLASTLIKMRGGAAAALRSIWHVAQREGWTGVRNCIASALRVATGADKYMEWIRRHDTLTDADLAEISRRIADLKHKPLLSVIMPVYNPPAEWLDQAIWSVRNQLYSHWELCIADDASTNTIIHSLLRRHAAEDSRIKLVLRTVNGNISRASNSALELATGEFVALLDHDDLLAVHALYWVAETINARPAAALIYSDEDKINLAGARYSPHFKCDWNPDLFLSQNMICHLGVYRTNLVRQAGGFREGYEGAQDYDLALRCIERIRDEQIVHIPRILYHWRAHPASTALSSSAKSYAFEAGRRAIAAHLSRKNIRAKVLPTMQYYRVQYAVPEPPPRVTLVIPTRNGLSLLRKCVDSICTKTDYPDYEILIVDNRSDDPALFAYYESLKHYARIRILHDDRPFNFSALNNRAVRECNGMLIGMLNNDTEVIAPGWLTEMVSLAMQPGVGAVGARLWYSNDTLQHAGVILGLGGVAGHSHKGLRKANGGYFSRAALLQSISAVTAACLVIRRETYLQAGGMDETNLPVAFNDVDFCLKVRALGYRNVWTPYAELYHHESATRGFEDSPEKEARFQREIAYMRKRWGAQIDHDPAYNPNLTLDHEDFSLAWPPRVGSLRRESSNGASAHVGSISGQ